MGYRQKNVSIGDADWQRLLVIFAEWEKWQKKADECGGKWPAGTWRYNATVMITKEVIETLNSNTEISMPVRRTLVKLWNRGTAPRRSGCLHGAGADGGRGPIAGIRSPQALATLVSLCG
jgi:hypothetical protein